MSNSPLVSHTNISPNKTCPRNKQIDTITIHCFVGQFSVERMCEMFESPKKKASANYVIGSDGRIGLCVDEADRSWCSSSSTNDNRAITIECASDLKHPYAINNKVMNSLINFVYNIWDTAKKVRCPENYIFPFPFKCGKIRKKGESTKRRRRNL